MDHTHLYRSACEKPLHSPPVFVRNLNIAVQLWLEIAEEPQKACPAWAYIAKAQEQATCRLVAVLNKDKWPTAAALARLDRNAIRWLVALAILDRCLTWPSNPILRAIHLHLMRLALGEIAIAYQGGLWAAYSLKDHPLLAPIDSLSPITLKSGIERFANFTAQVDATRLSTWRAALKKGIRNKFAPIMREPAQ
jgi:hypothetical protein